MAILQCGKEREKEEGEIREMVILLWENVLDSEQRLNRADSSMECTDVCQKTLVCT